MAQDLTKLQGRSPTVYEDTVGIAPQPERRTRTPSVGSGTRGLTALGNRPKAEEVPDILWKLSTLKPWQIAPEDQKAVKDALSVLDWALIPVTTEEATFWLSRLLAHFPRRDTASDSVVLSDLSADLVDAGASLIAVADTCDTVRKSATAKNPWLPPSGEILNMAIKRTKQFATYQHQLKTPRLAAPEAKEPPPLHWTGRKWETMPDDLRLKLWEYLRPMEMFIRESYCRVAGFHPATVINWGEEYDQRQGLDEDHE